VTNTGALTLLSTTSLTDLFVGSFRVQTIVVANVTATAATITIQDKQVTPVAALKTVSIAANTTQVFNFGSNGILFQGGLSAQAGTANAITVGLSAAF